MTHGEDEGERVSIHVGIREDSDVVMARQHARRLGQYAGLSQLAVEALATAITEIGRNILDHAGGGEIVLAQFDQDGRRGIAIRACDNGPGIADLEQAMQDGYSTGKGLGLGLPSARRLMDEFELVSSLGGGTTIKMIKWI